MTPRQRKEIAKDVKFKADFAANFKKVREAKNISVYELADKMGINYQTIYRWESADRCPINEQILDAAEALGVKIADLIPKR